MMLLAALSATAGALDASAVNPTISRFNAGSVFDIPSLSDAQTTKLLRGEVVRLLHPTAGDNYQVVGLLLVSLPMERVWLAGQDPHFATTAATEKRLTKSGDRATWYGFMDLPMGFSDRQWVVNVWNNHDLAQSTGNQMWEHPWQLHPDADTIGRAQAEAGTLGGITLAQYEAAVMTPSNEGALAFLATGPDETLLVYHATTAVGGNIPERLMAEFAKATLEGYLRKVEKNARDVVPTHYSGDHYEMLGGDGQPIPVR